MKRPGGGRTIGRRAFLALTGSAAVAAFLAACGARPSPSRSSDAGSPAPATPTPPASSLAAGPTPTPASPARPSSSPAPRGVRTLYRGANLATGRSAQLETAISILVADGRIAWIRPADAEEDPGPVDGLTIVDA